MDDLSLQDERLVQALRDLGRINYWLGGYTATDNVLSPLLRCRDSLQLLDLGCGLGDYLVHIVRRGAQCGCTVEAVGVDANPATVGLARSYLDRHLSTSVRSQVSVTLDDALALSYERKRFDVTHAALFLHHFHGQEALRLLREMHRIARNGLLVNDLHRHPLAYVGIWGLSRVARMAPMVQHDGPLSVRRGFRREELGTLAENADLPVPSIQWHWAFRWTLSTISKAESRH